MPLSHVNRCQCDAPLAAGNGEGTDPLLEAVHMLRNASCEEIVRVLALALRTLFHPKSTGCSLVAVVRLFLGPNPGNQAKACYGVEAVVMPKI